LTARLTKDAIILIHGGGNFGDLWPSHQRFREEVIAAFPTHKIIQLPQTIYFREQSNLACAKSVLNKHPNLTILVRDLRSLEFARQEFTAPSYLCPDMAFAVGLLRRPARPSVDVLWLCRTDLESSGKAFDLSVAGIERVDWLDEADTSFTARIRWVGTRLCYRPRVLWWVWPHMIHVFDALARQRLLRGCRILSRGKIVMTDRLHGHILSLLLGTPHVLLDNNYGKLRSFYETWTRDSALTQWADSPAEAVELARSQVHGLA
jgi:pyruvyl transferase EpsO